MFIRTLTACFLLNTALISTVPAAAQDIFTESLGAASAFDAGALSGNDVSLPSSLWQGTSSDRAQTLIQNVPLQSGDPLIRSLLRAALLSPGIPPQGDREGFEAARLSAVMKLGDQAALQTFLTRNPALGQTPETRVNIALLQMDSTQACTISDGITTDRAAPKWARLRALCHMLRGETAAAELTKDLLQNNDYDDPAFFALLSQMGGDDDEVPPQDPNEDALINFMRNHLSSDLPASTARDVEVEIDKRLAAIWGNLSSFSAADIQAIASDISFDEADLEGSTSFDFESVINDASPRAAARLFLLAEGGDIRAINELANQAKDKGHDAQDIITLFGTQLLTAAPEEQVETNLKLFTQAAINRRDLAALSAFHAALDGQDTQNRIALAADALGNGFQGRPLGKDIDARLASDNANESRAIRDAALGLALGAQMSEAGRSALEDHKLDDGRSLKQGDVILLQTAVQKGSIAEAVLQITSILDGAKLDSAAMFTVIRSLTDLGLYELAGQVAAQDFVDTL